MKIYFKKIWNWFLGRTGIVKDALSDGMLVANQIKQVTDSTLLTAIVKATPTMMDDAGLELIRKGLAAFIVVMGWAEMFIKDIEAKDLDAKAVVLTAINAKVAVLVAKAEGETLTIQQALASAPVIYNPKLLV